MEERELAEVVEQQQPYFEAVPAPSSEEDEGTRDMGPLYPFLISGGTNTERYYFTHINDTTDKRLMPMPYFNKSQLEQSIIALLQEQGLLKNVYICAMF